MLTKLFDYNIILVKGSVIMAKTSTNISIDSDIKAKAQELFADFGLDLSTAINMFLRQSVRENAIPFNISREVPNEETVAAIMEMDDILSGKIPAKRYSTTKELFEDLDS